MRPLGVGIDLVELRRVERMLERYGDRALCRLLTVDERGYCQDKAYPARHIAARLAAKEAAYKALAQSDDPGLIGWTDVEVAREIAGGPTLRFHGRAAVRARHLGVGLSLVSLTHTSEHAAAVVVLYQP